MQDDSRNKSDRTSVSHAKPRWGESTGSISNRVIGKFQSVTELKWTFRKILGWEIDGSRIQEPVPITSLSKAPFLKACQVKIRNRHACFH